MRVLLAAHAFPPRSTAGVEVYTLRLARSLQGLGHDVLVLSAAHDLSAAPYALRRRIHMGVPVAEVVNVHHRGTLEATYEDDEIDRAAARVIAEFRPDQVHVQHLLNLSSGLLAEAKRSRASVLVTLHDYWLSCPRDGLRMRSDLGLCETMDHRICASCLKDSPYLVPPAQRGLSAMTRRAGLGRHLHRLHELAPRTAEAGLRVLRTLAPPSSDGLADAMDRRATRLRAALEGVDAFLAPTEFARDRAVEFGVPQARVRVVPLGAVPGPARPRRAGPRPRVGFIGTLAPHKGVHVLVEAFRGLAAGNPRLDLFGSETVHPSYVAELRRASGGDDRIRFRGPFAEGGQEGVLAEIDVVALPSVWWENSPLTALEALAAGLPVVASRIGGVPEIVSAEDSGILVPPGDVASLRSALGDVVEGRALAGERAPVALKTVAEGARELAEIYESLPRRS